MKKTLSFMRKKLVLLLLILSVITFTGCDSKPSIPSNEQIRKDFTQNCSKFAKTDYIVIGDDFSEVHDSFVEFQKGKIDFKQYYPKFSDQRTDSNNGTFKIKADFFKVYDNPASSNLKDTIHSYNTYMNYKKFDEGWKFEGFSNE